MVIAVAPHGFDS